MKSGTFDAVNAACFEWQINYPISASEDMPAQKKSSFWVVEQSKLLGYAIVMTLPFALHFKAVYG